MVSVLGIDAGATLVKLAYLDGGDTPRMELVPATEQERVQERVEAIAPLRVGLTGCGAGALARAINGETTQIAEFEAWARGASRLLRADGGASVDRYLLVSVGTGTSVLLVDDEQPTRVGGTALGGGTLLGLGSALTGATAFEDLCALARRGHRSHIDLMIADIYGEGEIGLPADATASAFAKFAGDGSVAPLDLPDQERADRAAAVVNLVGENVALVCAGLAAASGAQTLVFGGSTLRGNDPLTAMLTAVTAAFGRAARYLPHGEFAGAVGALEHARDR